MALWFKNLVLIPFLAFVIMFGAGNVRACEFNFMPQQQATKMTSDMPCHQTNGKMTMNAGEKHSKNGHHNNCCDVDCNCSYNHCSGVIALAVPDFAFNAQFIDNIKKPQSIAFTVIGAQSPPERPPKHLS